MGYKYNGAHLDESKECGVIPGLIGTCRWEYTYDGRGNLISEDKYTRTTSDMEWQNVAAYVYDETNRLVQGKNEDGEVSLYTYNGLGMRVGRELIMEDNTHGYTDFHDLTPSVDTGLTTPEVVKESYVIDYTSATFNPLTMDEDGGFSYRYVYGLDKLSVKITSEGTNWWGQHVTTDILKDYYHQDRLGSTTNLTDKFGRVVGRADYNEWGEITYREALSITSSYRRIYPQSSYTGHDWDDVLGMYYAKARFYSAEDKRFVAMDPVKGQIIEPLSLVPYLYCVDNPLRWVDPAGLRVVPVELDGCGGTVTQTDVEQAATKFAPYSYSASSYTADKAREHDLLLGLFAAVIINSGKSAGMVLQLLKEFGDLVRFLPSDSDYNFYTQTSDNLQIIETYFYLPQVTFKDSYYAGKALGDLISAAAGIGMAIKGLAEVFVGANGTAAGLLASATGVGSVLGVPAVAVNVAAVIDGVASGVTGAAITGHALGNFGDDLEKFEYYKKLVCQEFSKRLNDLMSKTILRTGNKVHSNLKIYDRIGVSDVDQGWLVAQNDFLDLGFEDIDIKNVKTVDPLLSRSFSLISSISQGVAGRSTKSSPPPSGAFAQAAPVVPCNVESGLVVNCLQGPHAAGRHGVRLIRPHLPKLDPGPDGVLLPQKVLPFL